MNDVEFDSAAIRAALAALEPSPRIEPNEMISVDRAFFPLGHRGVLDLRRQLVVGNRGMGKSFWTHALLSQDVRRRLANVYGYSIFSDAEVVIGFNGSDKINATAPTIDEITTLLSSGIDAVLIWRAVFIRISLRAVYPDIKESLYDFVNLAMQDPNLYSKTLSEADDWLTKSNTTLLVVFDALDRLGRDWETIRILTRALLSLVVGLQSFKSIRSKIFMRTDQFLDQDLFRFPDGSKIKNNHVDLIWKPAELYGLLLFEVSRFDAARNALKRLAERERATDGVPSEGVDQWWDLEAQARLINAIAGEFMGTDKKRGRVYTWVPLHLSDAAGTCSPRSFLIAWKKAAEHRPLPASGRAIDHLGLQDGVRSASTSRLIELYEDYPWIEPALEALRRQFVPIERNQLFEIWDIHDVIWSIMQKGQSDVKNTPVKFSSSIDPLTLLSSMRDVGVMEERANYKINVPDIFRVEAEILRRGGVAVPKRHA